MLLVLAFSRIFSTMWRPFSSTCRRFSSSLSPTFFFRSSRLRRPLLRFPSSPNEATADACCCCSPAGVMALRDVYSGDPDLLSDAASSWSFSVDSIGFLSINEVVLSVLVSPTSVVMEEEDMFEKDAEDEAEHMEDMVKEDIRMQLMSNKNNPILKVRSAS